MRVKHLKTNINAGGCDIWLCGKQVHSFDALDIQHHTSIPTLVNYILSSKDIQRCNSVDDKHRTLAIEYVGRSIQHHWSYREKDFKVEVLGVKMCYLELHN